MGISPWVRNLAGVSELKRWIIPGLGLAIKKINLEDKVFKLQTWFLNTGKKSPFFEQVIRNMYIVGSDGAFLVYDITNSESLSQIPEWIKLIREKCGSIPVFLVGNNCDFEDHRQVSKKQADNLVQKYNLAGNYEISVQTEKNLDLPFQKISEFYLDVYFNRPLSAVEM